MDNINTTLNKRSSSKKTSSTTKRQSTDNTLQVNMDKRLQRLVAQNALMNPDNAISSMIRQMNQNTQSKQGDHHLMILLETLMQESSMTKPSGS